MFEVGGGSVHPREVVKMLLTQSISSQVQKIRRLCRLLFYLREMCALCASDAMYAQCAPKSEKSVIWGCHIKSTVF